ncbi:hypothetical protein GALMADRAFT_139403 [Galerina marginata CBS 339.88]|uniref:Uncharacterized protein n=1 Tax=Galerina marginata (strain CBS 339.88) TaxID=685588 RepID=A0A067T046_GALM3|nr:hypothetical protein GALMADRAFT_139403 [Galerina marginata CBS 339.88]
MARTWRVVNLDRKQTDDRGEELDILFSRQTVAIFYIAIPDFSVPQNHLPNKYLPGSWVGDRLICIEDSMVEELPDGCISREEIDFYQGRRPVEIKHTPEAGAPSSLSALVINSFEKLSLKRVNLHVTNRQRFDEHRVWVLRNLSKRQYVRSRLLQDPSMPPSPWPVQVLKGFTGLGLVLQSRILWSRASSQTLGGSGFHLQERRGAWAGDRFDVRLSDDVQEDMHNDPAG